MSEQEKYNGETINGRKILKIVFFDDKKTLRIYYKDGEVTDAEII
jgi:hypothetical protein